MPNITEWPRGNAWRFLLLPLAACGLVLFCCIRPAAGQLELSEVLAAIDEPARSWASMAARWRAEGPAALDKLLALHDLLEAQVEVDQMEARLAAHARLARLDQLVDLVAAQPHAAASRLFWFGTIDGSLREAERMHRPLLIADIPPSPAEPARLAAIAYYCHGEVASCLRQRFVLCVCHEPEATVPAGSVTESLVTPNVEGEPVHIVVDALGRPVHALRGYCTPDDFLDWLHDAEGLAAQTYQLSDTAARQRIAQSHAEWLRRDPSVRPPRASLDRDSRLLLASQRSLRLPDQGEDQRATIEELEAFLEQRAAAQDPDSIHQLFIEGIFARSPDLLRQKLQ